jgi:hypothetical protein
MTNAPSYDGYSKYTGSVAATYDSDRQVEAQWWKEDQFVREYFSETIAPRLLDIPVGGPGPWSGSTCPRTCSTRRD